MSLPTKIARNTIIHLIGKITGLIFSLASIAVMTRYLGQEGFGYYITATAFGQIFAILVDFGLTLTTVQMISRPGIDLNRTMNAIMSFRVISTAVFLSLAPLLVWFFPYNIFIKWGVVITFASFFSYNLFQTLTGLFQKELKMFKLTIAEVAGRVLMFGLVVIMAILGAGIYWIFGALSLGNILMIVLAFWFSRKYVKWQWQIDFGIWKEILKRTWPIALSISFNLLYLRMDTVILSLTRSQSEVGLYGAAYRVVDILTMLPAVFMGIILPVATQYFAEKKTVEMRGLLQKAFDALMIFAVPIVFGTMIVGRPLMALVAGQEFVNSGDILKILILASGIIFASSLTAYTVVALNKQKTMMWGYLAAAVLTLSGYLLFIPRFGYWAAAWFTVFSEALILVLTAVLVYRAIKFAPRLGIFLKTVPAAGIMAAVIYSLRDWPVIALLAVAAGVYFCVLLAVGGIKRKAFIELARIK